MVAIIEQDSDRWITRVVLNGSAKVLESEQDAKEWAEARMNEFKKEFILSLITKDGYNYKFGNILEMFGGYEGVDEWTVYRGDDELFEGTLEECKNYIVSCF